MGVDVLSSTTRVFNLFVKDDVDYVIVVSCVESAVVGVSVCICDKSESFVMSYLYFVFDRDD